MLPRADDCDECTPAHLQRRLQATSMSAVVFSSLPFILTFFIVGTTVLQKLFPLLSGNARSKSYDGRLPRFTSFTLNPSSWSASLSIQRVAAFTFSTTIAMATVLAELILCEISNTLDPVVRTLAFNVTVTTLLFLLIVALPLLEIHATIRAAGWSFSNSRIKFAWLLGSIVFGAWLLVFWWLGQSIPDAYLRSGADAKGLVEGCTERIGVIGILLMAILSGFASISSPWQTFWSRPKRVTDADLARKRAGLVATDDMLAAKQSRLRVLERKMSDAPQEGFMTKMIGSIRGNADVQERKTLQLEISGLETMRASLSSSLTMLQQRQTSQVRAKTLLGRFISVGSYIFSVYCVYRIGATSLATLRRWWYPEASFAKTDPINNFLAVIAKHWDPSIDRVAYARQLAFLFSALMLLASFNSVVQTFYLFSRAAPSLVQHVHANLPLLVSQICATYVISSALLLRSSLPTEVGSVISDAIGVPLDPAFVDRWFEGWFLMASALTAAGIFVGRKIGGNGEWDDDDEFDVEMGKRS